MDYRQDDSGLIIKNKVLVVKTFACVSARSLYIIQLMCSRLLSVDFKL